jgi:hypothetical protein
MFVILQPQTIKHSGAKIGEKYKREFFELLKSYKNNKQHNFVLCE